MSLDCEFAANYIPGQDASIELVQVSTRQRNYVIFLKQVGNKQVLSKLLLIFEEPKIMKLGLGTNNDFKALGKFLNKDKLVFLLDYT